MPFWGGGSSCLSICWLKDDRLLETWRAEGSRPEAACAGGGQRQHTPNMQQRPSDAAGRGRARPKEDMGVNAQLAPVALLLRLKKGNEFSKMWLFLARRCAWCFNNRSHSKGHVISHPPVLNSIRHHQGDQNGACFMNLLCVLHLTTLIS